MEPGPPGPAEVVQASGSDASRQDVSLDTFPASCDCPRTAGGPTGRRRDPTWAKRKRMCWIICWFVFCNNS